MMIIVIINLILILILIIIIMIMYTHIYIYVYILMISSIKNKPLIILFNYCQHCYCYVCYVYYLLLNHYHYYIMLPCFIFYLWLCNNVTHIQLPYSHCYRLLLIFQAVDSEQPSWASAGLAASFWASAPGCFARCPANSWTSGIHTLVVTEQGKHMAKEEWL